MSNLELQIQKINESLKGCISTNLDTAATSVTECLQGFISLATGKDAILEFKDLQTLEIKLHSSRSIKECQLLISKKLLAFIEILKSFIKSSDDPKLKKASIVSLIGLSRLHIQSLSNLNNAELLTLLDEGILQETLRTIIEGNDPICLLILAKQANKYGDLAVLVFSFYSRVIQEENDSKSFSEEKVDSLWALIKGLGEEFRDSFKNPFYGKETGRKSSSVNSKRKSPYKEEAKTGEEDTLEQSIQLYQKTFQRLSLNFLKISTLTEVQIEEYLKLFSKKIIPKLENPLLFADYLMFHFEKGTSADIQILALSNIFILIVRHALDLPNYYNKLYSILSKHLATPNDSFLFKSKYKHRFLKLLENSLRTNKIPVRLVASYIKILARVALRTEASDTLWICSLLFNLVKKNDSLVNMIRAASHQTKTTDTFLPLEEDTLKTNALENALWELKTLKNHYCKEVRDLVELFSNIEKVTANIPLNTDDFTDISLDNLVASNLAKAKLQKNVRLKNLDEEPDLKKFLKGTTLGNLME